MSTVHNHMQFCRRITGRTYTGREDRCSDGPMQVESFVQRLMLRYGIFWRDTASLGKTFRAASPGIYLRLLQHFIRVNLPPRLASTVLQRAVGKRSLQESHPLSTKEQLRLQQISGTGSRLGLVENMAHRLGALKKIIEEELIPESRLIHLTERLPWQQTSGIGNRLVLIEKMIDHMVVHSKQSVMTKCQFKYTRTDQAQSVSEKLQPTAPAVQRIFHSQPVPAFPSAAGSQRMSQPPITMAPYFSDSAQTLPPGTVVGSNANGPSGLGAKDINHLTNEVIQAIDQRILAQRERLGRV